MSVYLIIRVLRFEEVDEFEDVGCAAHPLRRIFDFIMRTDAELFEPAVGDILDILVDVVGVQAEDAVREKILVVCSFELDAFDDNIFNFIRELGRSRFPDSLREC